MEGARKKRRDRAEIQPVNFLYYFGALMIVTAMVWFPTLALERFGGAGLAAIAVLYACGFVLGGRRLWARENLKTAGGLFYTLAVFMTPLAIYGFQRMTGLWLSADPGEYRGFNEWIRGGWFLMETGTVIAGLVSLWWIRFPFLTFPITFSLW